jgi:hypothetical protein
MNEDPDHHGDAVWFQIEDTTLTMHRYQIKLGESQLSGTTGIASSSARRQCLRRGRAQGA